jgi:uncharacterized iron-regulated membrane protein
MNGTFRQSMAWLHTWSGLVIGWVLYMMFLAGAAAVFKDEISVWMRPEVSHVVGDSNAIALAQHRLATVATDAARWSITLPDAREPTTQISWTPQNARESSAATRELLDSNTGQPLTVRETRGGDLFYRLHYRLEIQGRNGWWFSGAAAVVMLVSLVSATLVARRTQCARRSAAAVSFRHHVHRPGAHHVDRDAMGHRRQLRARRSASRAQQLRRALGLLA